MKNVFKGEKTFNNTSRERTKKEETEKIRERLRKTKEANVRNYYEQRRKQKQEKFKERDDTIIRNGCVLVHKQKHFDDFVLQKELSLRARRHVTCHTHNPRACTRERERERDRPLRDYAFTRGLYFNGFGASPPILSILCASYSS